MLTFIFISVLVIMLLIVVVIAGSFVRAAFWGERDMAEEAKEISTWRPPFIHGATLRNWATTTAERLAGRRLQGQRNSETAVQLAKELEEGAGRTMLPLARQAELERIVECPETGQGLIGVTAPEVLAVAAHLRQTHSSSEMKRIYEMAAENAKVLATQESAENQPHSPPLPCPLQGQDRVCCVYETRPLRCRPLHAALIAQEMGSRRTTPLASRDETSLEATFEQTVEQGIEAGLTRALEQAEVDANVYELNSALAIALATLDAAERWAKGENVFATCLLIDRVRPTNQ